MKKMPKEKTVKQGSSKRVIFENLEMLEGKGTYTLVFFVPVERSITVGRLGVHKFSRGYYAYTGSAFGRGGASLGRRILRHLRREKKKKWHIDYVLSGDNAEVTAVIAAHTREKIECEINCDLRDRLQAKIPVPRFGSSDCKENCGSHLLYLGLDENIVKRVAGLYSEKVGAEVYVFCLH